MTHGIVNHWGKNRLNNKWGQDICLSLRKKEKLDSYLVPCTKINSRWIKGSNMKGKALKHLRKYLDDYFRILE